MNMLTIKDNLSKINEEIRKTAIASNRDPKNIMLIGVSKKKDVNTIQKGIDAGLTHLGENYIQEAIQKIKIIGKEHACWHFIGHLQSNKAKLAVQYFDYIHTIDRFKLALEIDKQAKINNKIQKILVQVNIGKEESKSGVDIEDTIELAKRINSLNNVSLKGLMCMPPFSLDPEHSRSYFKFLFELKKSINNIKINHLSMGMSHDFKVAIEEQATMIRIGTSIFGRRN